MSVPKQIEIRPWRQAALITLAAVGLYLGFRALPVGSDLNHIDFRAGPGAIEFCDPSNPQFIPVVAVRSPVTMSVETLASSAMAGTETEIRVRLSTASGKPIGENDLLVAHTKKLHLLAVDPTLQDYQHVHPESGPVSGEWHVRFTPRSSGRYRLFADFTPAATARGLYASAELDVAGRSAEPADSTLDAVVVEREGFRFSLTADEPLRAGRTAELAFQVARADGGNVSLQPVMGAFAHLVAFDSARSGFAHLHPNETDLSRPPDEKRPRLTFKVTIPAEGRYVIWAQVNLNGREAFVPFWVTVGP